MKALCLYFHMMPNMFPKILENEIWNFSRNLPMATSGSERVKREKPSLPVDFCRSKLNRVKTLKSPKRALVKMVQYHKN